MFGKVLSEPAVTWVARGNDAHSCARVHVRFFIAAQVTPTGPGNGAGSRLVVSDGAHFMSCTLSKLVDDMIKTGMVGKHSVVRFVQYTLEDHVDKSDASKQIRSVVVAAMEHLGAQERVGTPVDVTKDASVKRHRGRVQKQGGGQAQAQAQAQAPKARGTAEAYSTIASLNPYRNKWIFKARVTKRGDKKTWSNAKGEGSLFSVDLLDAEGTEIRATFWKEAVDMFYDMLPPGSVATFSGGKLKSANLKFTTIKNPYELTFDASSTIKLAADTDGTIKSASFAFVKLAEVERAENDATVDVVGVVTDFTGVSSLTAKASGRELFKRDVTLVDDSGVAVRLTLWGADAQRDDAAFCGNTVMCVKGARVGEYHGKNLSSGFSSVVMLDATDVPEAVALKAWWAASGSSTPAKTLSCGQRGRFEDRKGVSVIRDDALGYGQGPDWVDIKAHITFVNTGGTFCYAACPEPDNHKKVMLQTDGTWLCEVRVASRSAWQQSVARRCIHLVAVCVVVDPSFQFTAECATYLPGVHRPRTGRTRSQSTATSCRSESRTPPAACL